jgi:hypothetical protein
VAIDGWDEKADVLRERVGISSVLRGPVFSDKLVDLIVEKLRAELVIGRGWNAGDSIVRGIDRRIFSLGFLEGKGGFLVTLISISSFIKWIGRLHLILCLFLHGSNYVTLSLYNVVCRNS